MITRTTTRLIEDLRDPSNSTAWSRFDARYRPVLVAFARRLGFSGDDASELAQQTLAEFLCAYRDGRYRREQGRLSSWLIGIARNIGSGMRRNRRAGVREGEGGAVGRIVGGDTEIGEIVADLPNEQEMTQIWARERESAILAEAMGVLRESTRTEANTVRAFELFALRGVPAEEVASQCNIAVESVYVIKNRLTKRLREIVRDLTAAYDEGE